MMDLHLFHPGLSTCVVCTTDLNWFCIVVAPKFILPLSSHYTKTKAVGEPPHTSSIDLISSCVSPFHKTIFFWSDPNIASVPSPPGSPKRSKHLLIETVDNNSEEYLWDPVSASLDCEKKWSCYKEKTCKNFRGEDGHTEYLIRLVTVVNGSNKKFWKTQKVLKKNLPAAQTGSKGMEYLIVPTSWKRRELISLVDLWE